MIREITIDGKSVPMKATASTAIRYRQWFNSDLLKDMMELYKVQSTNSQEFSYEQLEMFLHLAYTMAKQADSSIPNDCNDWLDEFSVFPIEEVFPEVIDLWQTSIQTLDKGKKK